MIERLVLESKMIIVIAVHLKCILISYSGLIQRGATRKISLLHITIQVIYSSFFIYFVPTSLAPQNDHHWVLEFQSQNIVHRDTRL